MTKLERLEKRLKEIRGGDDARIPSWLSAVGSQQEIGQWLAINQTCRGWDRCQRIDEFIHKMRARHPNMPLTIEEEVEAIVERLKRNPWLRWCEGLHDDPVVDKIMMDLTLSERVELSAAIRALESATVETLPPNQQAAWEKARQLYRELEETSQSRALQD